MAWVKTPSTWFGSWAEDATNITVPIASFPELNATEADGATGDIRKILFAICEKCWTVWNALATADKSAKMVITKSSTVNTSTGVITHNYTFTFQNVVATQEVADEA